MRTPKLHVTTPLPAATAWLLLAASATAQSTPEEALAALTAGNQRFASEDSIPQPVGPGTRRTLARGQHPWAIVVTCADSRVAPEHVFDTGLGELFVVRVAGNVCDPESLASIEYAAEHLGTPLCVVLGHEHCGAVKACLQWAGTGTERVADDFSLPLRSLMQRIEPAVRAARQVAPDGAELAARAEEENAQLTARNCMARSPVLRRRERATAFRMVAARYHMETGEVEWLPNRPWAANEHVAAPHPDGPETGLPPHVALRMLRAGHRRFLSNATPVADVSRKRRQDLLMGQRPLAIVVACSDSRVSPEHLFDAGLGELFTIRVAGNVLNDDVLASVEYAALHTGASLCLVLGHTGCGAVTAAVAADEHGGHHTESMHELLRRLGPAVDAAKTAGLTGDSLVQGGVERNATGFVAQARLRSPELRRLEERGKFAFLSAVYDLKSGDLSFLEDDGVAAQSGDPHAVPHAAPLGETSGTHGGHGTGSLGLGDEHGAGHEPAPDDGRHGAEAARAPEPTPEFLLQQQAWLGKLPDTHGEASGAATGEHASPTVETETAAEPADVAAMLIGLLGMLTICAAAAVVWHGRRTS